MCKSDLQEIQNNVVPKAQLNQTGTIGNSKIADSGGKLIFEEPVLCAQLLNDYVDMSLLRNIRPEDIEDVTERFIPMFTEERDADVVKKVHLPNKEDVFITLIEHKSGVDYNVVMQILRYMVFIWEDYEKQQEKDQKGIANTKSFKYPPILPIVYYEGSEEWPADMMLSDRIALNEAFSDFIPNFKYHLISLNKYNKTELMEKKNGLSFVMLINSIKNAEDFKNLHLPDGYFDDLQKTSPDAVLAVIARVIAVVLRKQRVPEDEIGRMVDQIKRRKHMGLFDEWQGFDVQEERKKGQVIGEAIGEQLHLIKQVCKKLSKDWNAEKIAELFDEPYETIKEICDIAAKYAPEYDAEKIFQELDEAKKAVAVEK